MSTIDRQPDVARGYPARRTNPGRADPDRANPVQPRHPGAEFAQDQQPPTAWRQRIPGPQLQGFVSGVTLLSGLWLMLAPGAWNYGGTGGGFDARWNDLLVGFLIAAVGVVRLARAIRLAFATLIALAAGAWLIVAPFALAYGLGADSTRAILNDLALGLLITAVTAVGHTSARMTVATRI